jgi:hypothetical protein
MRKLSTTLLFASILLAVALTALPLDAEGNDSGMKNEQCDMMRGRQGSMMGGGGMMQGDRGGMISCCCTAPSFDPSVSSFGSFASSCPSSLPDCLASCRP